MNLFLSLSSIKRSPKIDFIRRWTNLLYYDPRTVNLKINSIDAVIIDSYKFKVSSQIDSVMRVENNSWFSNTRSTDIALDIGANIGAVTIPLASKCKKVYAVEPIYFNELEDNLKLNNLYNVEVIRRGIGNNSKETEISFAGRSNIVEEISFNKLRLYIASKGQDIDFLKMDGEGCEWTFLPEELKGIRELRIEFHIIRGRSKDCKKRYNRYIDWMTREGYRIKIEHPNYGPDPYNTEDYVVTASLKEGLEVYENKTN